MAAATTASKVRKHVAQHELRQSLSQALPANYGSSPETASAENSVAPIAAPLDEFGAADPPPPASQAPWSRNSLAGEALDPPDPPRIHPGKKPAHPFRVWGAGFRVLTL